MEKAKSINPATLEVIGEYEVTPVADIPAIVVRAREAQKSWAALTFAERAEYIIKARDYMLVHSDEIAQTISNDTGKPRIESYATEVFPVLDLIGHFVKHGEHMLRDRKIKLRSPLFINKRSFIGYEPVGVVAIISPWNYPFCIPIGDVIMGLLAGNAVILKTSSETPIVGLKIEEVIRSTGIPHDIFHLASGPGSTVGNALLNADVDKISFTGSVSVGRRVMEVASKKLIPVKLELGGADPMIVMPDADIERATNGAIWGCFTNSGQTCAGIQRVIVHRSIFQKFLETVTAKTLKLRQGWDTDFNIDVGSMITKGQFEDVSAQVEAAKEEGARVVCGGKARSDLKGYFYPPTIITDVTPTMKIMNEEVFGPVMVVAEYDMLNAAIELANGTAFGLTASVWTKDNDKGIEVARKIKAGIVTVNDHVYTHGLCETPWMGIKESGFGASHGEEGMLELCRKKHINYDIMPLKRNLWWHPYSEKLYLSLKGGADILFNVNLVQKVRKTPAFMSLISKMWNKKDGL